MDIKMTLSRETKAVGDVYFAMCQRTRDFVGASVLPVFDRHSDQTDAFHSYHGAMLRITAWLRSLCKLNQPSDFQPILAASRACFEIAVDMTLLCLDDEHPCTKLLAWERSAKLKAAERVARRYQDQSIPNRFTPLITFINEQRTSVHDDRAIYWNGRHPSRWTGQNLELDARAADRCEAHGFVKYYDERYAQACWSVHGSGLASVRYLSEDVFPSVAAFGYAEAAAFSVVAARQAMRLIGQFDAVVEARFNQFYQDVEVTRQQVWARHMRDWIQ